MYEEKANVETHYDFHQKLGMCFVIITNKIKVTLTYKQSKSNNIPIQNWAARKYDEEETVKYVKNVVQFDHFMFFSDFESVWVVSCVYVCVCFEKIQMTSIDLVSKTLNAFH